VDAGGSKEQAHLIGGDQPAKLAPDLFGATGPQSSEDGGALFYAERAEEFGLG
jgi:hypothetical protein